MFVGYYYVQRLWTLDTYLTQYGVLFANKIQISATPFKDCVSSKNSHKYTLLSFCNNNRRFNTERNELKKNGFSLQHGLFIARNNN